MSKITFNRLNLLENMKVAINFVPKKSVLPATEDFLLTIKDSGASITATDLEKMVTVNFEVLKSEKDISICIPAKLIFKTISLMIDEEVSFNCKEDKNIVEVKCGKSKYKIMCNDASAFPLMESGKHDYEASFTGASFNAALEVTSKYASPDNTVDALRGICFRMCDNKINVYGASSFQFAKIVVTPRSVNNWEDIIIPSAAAQAITKCIGDGDIVDVFHSKVNLEISTPQVKIMIRSIDVKYPDMEKFFVKSAEAFVVLNTLQFLHALERLELYTTEDSSLLRISVANNLLMLKVINNELGREGEDEIEVTSTKDIIVGASVDYLLNVLRSFTNDSFKLGYGDIKSPIFIEPVNEFVDNDRFFLIAPMTINN